MGGRELAEGHCNFPSEGIVVRSAHLTQLLPGFIHGRPASAPELPRALRWRSRILIRSSPTRPSTRQICALLWAT